MGDILHALPSVTALRQAHPGWIIDWIIEPVWSALLSAEPGAAAPHTSAQPVVDRLHFAATRRWRRAPFSASTCREISSLRHDLRDAGYDAVLDLQGSVRSAVIGKLTGCRRRIGEAEPRERPARWLFTERVTTRSAHVIEQDIELATAVAGDELLPVQPRLPVDSASESWCNALLAVQGGRSIALLNPGAGWGAKRWPPERYAAVAVYLAGRGYRTLVNSGPGEEALSQAVCNAAEGSAEPVSCTLSQLISLTRRAALVVGGDTGPLHLACALKRPVVGIYGPTDPARNGPYATRFRVLRSPESRRDHTRHAEPEAGLLTISPEAVLAAIEDLLAPEHLQ